MQTFYPIGAGSWYFYEMIDENTYMCFANLGDPQMAECGSVSISELQNLTLQFGLTIERDIYFGDHSLQEVIDIVKSGGHV